MTPAKLGSLIGGAFGLVFVLVNTGGLVPGAAIVLRTLAVAAFVVVLLAIRRPNAPGRQERPVAGFTRGYWIVVLAEVVLIFAGLAVLNGPADTPQAAVAWVSSVVGAHFFGLAAVWREPFFNALGFAILVCGLSGLALAAAGAEEGPINFMGGVLPGALLLGFALWGTRRDA